MNNLADPVKILLCGGAGVGKTSILRRLADFSFPEHYVQTSGLNVLEMRANLKNSASIKVLVYDLGSDLIQSGPGADATFLSVLTSDTDGAMVVLNGSNPQSIKEADVWLEFLAKNTNKKISKYLLVHKADMPVETRVVTARTLDIFVAHEEIDGWSLTVGHPALGDCDMSRGSFTNQKPPEDVLSNLVLRILRKRQGNICRLVPVPFRMDFVQWSSYDESELDRKFVNNESVS
jgi:hypothetical protein